MIDEKINANWFDEEEADNGKGGKWEKKGK
jgi:hypothetical protein